MQFHDCIADFSVYYLDILIFPVVDKHFLAISVDKNSAAQLTVFRTVHYAKQRRKTMQRD